MSAAEMIARLVRRVALVGLLGTAMLGLGAAAARADSPAGSFSATTSTQVAGAHPDLMIDITPASQNYPALPGDGGIPHPSPLENLQNVSIHLPPGLLANVASTPTCAESVLESGNIQDCPADSQIGLFSFEWASQFATDDVGNPTPGVEAPPTAIINEAPLPGEVARFGISLGGIALDLHIDVTVADQSDYGVVATVTGIPVVEPLINISLDFWGDPASPANDASRLACYDFADGGGFTPNCMASLTGSPTFMVNPTSCSGTPAPVTATETFYGDPNTYTLTSDLPPTTGCSSLPFDPSLAFADTSGLAGQPDAFSANLSVPQDDPSDTSGSTTSALQGVTVALPAGVALSPSAAGGLGACTDAEFALGVHVPDACPSDSQIGTGSITTPYLTNPLTGYLYVGSQESSDPASGDMYRVLLAADGNGVLLKLVGNVVANPSTGQLTISFPNDPQVQFSDLQLSLPGGPQAVLVNPYSCGTATSSYSMTSYSNPSVPVTGASSFSVTGDCGVASQFSPSLAAGTASDRAGGSSPFSFTLTRPDGQQWLSGISNVTLPTGLNADIASVTPCASSAAATGACPASSQVGTAAIAAGAGTDPFNLTGQPVYLTGPYEGAPYGLAVVVNAVAGPFDLGTVVVRQAIRVNPSNAQVTISSDPLPTMLGGVPLDIQQISLDIDRPGFMRSPTSCAAKTISATVQGSTPGAAATLQPGTDIGFAPSTTATAHPTAPMQMGDCGALKFSPKLKIVLSGKGQTRTGDHPLLTATLTQPAGQANLHAVRVALPLSLALDPNNSEHVCSVTDAAKIACPDRTVVGYARADTRILPHPLSGKVYLVQGTRKGPHGTTIKTLPRLLIPLRGQDGVDINLHAQTSVNSAEQLVTTFPSIPDAGISRFTLKIDGGHKGILVITGGKDICRGAQTAISDASGQNGRPYDTDLRLRTPACTTHG